MSIDVQRIVRFYLSKQKKPAAAVLLPLGDSLLSSAVGARVCVSSLGGILNHFLAVEKEERPMIARLQGCLLKMDGCQRRRRFDTLKLLNKL